MLKILYWISSFLSNLLTEIRKVIDTIEIRKGIKAESKEFPNYFIYADGQIYNKKKNFFLTQTINQRGYMMVTLFKDNDSKRYPKLVHSLVAKAFLENPLNYPNVAHKNGIFTDNRKENLFFCSQITNINNAIKLGDNHRNGELNPNNVLPLAVVNEIRKAIASGVSQADITKNYGISQSNVSDIKNNKIWKQ